LLLLLLLLVVVMMVVVVLDVMRGRRRGRVQQGGRVTRRRQRRRRHGNVGTVSVQRLGPGFVQGRSVVGAVSAVLGRTSARHSARQIQKNLKNLKNSWREKTIEFKIDSS
jgi:ABC-type Fe3+ transport system permease subunit